MKTLLAIAILLIQSGAPRPACCGPHFTRSPQGWLPTCPTGTTLVRHNPPPDCIWGVKPMNRKPSEGDMECVDTAKVSKLASCPAE